MNIDFLKNLTKDELKQRLRIYQKSLKSLKFIWRTEINRVLKEKIKSKKSFEKQIIEEIELINEYEKILGYKLTETNGIEYIHYSRIFSFPFRKDETTLCQLKLDVKYSVTNNPDIVNCPICLNEIERGTKCSICRKILTDNELSTLLGEHNFMNTCLDHRKYQLCFNIEKIKKDLGYDYKGLENCSICNKKLNNDEIESLEYQDFMITCFEHRKYRKYFDIETVKN
jgi:hypothetical protein